jgi:hypothetical protein
MHDQEGSAVPTEPLSNGRYAANVRANATASIVDEMMRRALTETFMEVSATRVALIDTD